jgi:hypothetical protein
MQRFHNAMRFLYGMLAHVLGPDAPWATPVRGFFAAFVGCTQKA